MFLLIMQAGCYSSARHVANVRPDIVKPEATLFAKYRLERIVLKKSKFSREVANGGGTDRRKYEELLKEDRKSGPGGTHAANTKTIFESVRTALYCTAVPNVMRAFSVCTDKVK